MYGDTIFPGEFRTGIQKIGGTGFTVTQVYPTPHLALVAPVDSVLLQW